MLPTEGCDSVMKSEPISRFAGRRPDAGRAIPSRSWMVSALVSSIIGVLEQKQICATGCIIAIGYILGLSWFGKPRRRWIEVRLGIAALSAMQSPVDVKVRRGHSAGIRFLPVVN
jgi:hypothetical protein